MICRVDSGAPPQIIPNPEEAGALESTAPPHVAAAGGPGIAEDS